MIKLSDFINEKLVLKKNLGKEFKITFKDLEDAGWYDLPQYDIDGSIDNSERFGISFGKIFLDNKIIGAWSYLWVDDRERTSVFTLILPEDSINNFISDEELEKHKDDGESNMPDDLVDLIDERGVYSYDRYTTYIIEEYTSAWAASMTDWAAIADMEEKFDEFYEKIIEPIGNSK